MQVRSTLAALALCTLSTIAACSDNTPTAPSTPTQTLDVTRLIGEMSLPALPAVTPSAAVSVGPTVPGNCQYDALSFTFACPPVSANGVTTTISYALYDVQGRPLSIPDASLVASMRTIATSAGKVTLPAQGGVSGTFTVSQSSDMTLTGLLTSQHVLNGTQAMKLDGTITSNGTPLTLSTTQTTTTTNVVLPVPASAPAAGVAPWPLSGKVTLDGTTTTAASTQPVTMHEEMTFNGTSKVTVTITVAGITQRCTVDLASPTTAAACS